MKTRRLVHLARVALLFTLAGATACDPCAGFSGCEVRPYVGAVGRILDDNTGRPVRGAVIDFIRTAGGATVQDSLRVTTDSDGQFSFVVDALSGDTTIATIAVKPPNRPGYRVRDVKLSVRTRRGDAHVLPPWSSVAHLRDLGEIFVRGAPPNLATGVPVEFRRTGGIEVDGLVDGVFRTQTDGIGRIPLFFDLVRPREVGELIGDLSITLPPPAGVTVHENVRIPARVDFGGAPDIFRFGAGPSLEYHVEVNRRGLFGVHVEGATVQFERTGGSEMTPNSWSSVTDVTGRVAFPVRAPAPGTVIGTLRIIPPTPWAPIERIGLEIPTFDSDAARLYGIVEVGPGLATQIRITAGAAPLEGVELDVQRTGGVSIHPARFTARSDAAGLAFISSSSDGIGEVIADVTVRPPAPHASFVVRDVHFTAIDGDTPNPLGVLAEWDVTSPPAGAAPRRR